MLLKRHDGGLIEITPKKHTDNRGYFVETWSSHHLLSAGINVSFVQDNLSLSKKLGTFRGFHYQRPPAAQAKLVRCASGKILDIAIDLRKAEKTFLSATQVFLDAELGNQLYIPAGFAHGFLTLEDNVEVSYKCSSKFEPDYDASINFMDDTFEIDWPLDRNNFIASDKDRNAPFLHETDLPF